MLRNPNRTQTTRPNLQVPTPCRVLRMPSQSVHIPEELYQWILDTKRDDQSTSKRVTKLLEKGKAWEEKHE